MTSMTGFIEKEEAEEAEAFERLKRLERPSLEYRIITHPPTHPSKHTGGDDI
jgi:hypothetical protein